MLQKYYVEMAFDSCRWERSTIICARGHRAPAHCLSVAEASSSQWDEKSTSTAVFPDLTPSDFYLFSCLKGCLSGYSFADADQLLQTILVLSYKLEKATLQAVSLKRIEWLRKDVKVDGNSIDKLAKNLLILKFLFGPLGYADSKMEYPIDRTERIEFRTNGRGAISMKRSCIKNICQNQIGGISWLNEEMAHSLSISRDDPEALHAFTKFNGEWRKFSRHFNRS
jgi:hypothetical protein